LPHCLCNTSESEQKKGIPAEEARASGQRIESGHSRADALRGSFYELHNKCGIGALQPLFSCGSVMW
jgi:hypothetical protein